jgi:hypothetical protein
MYSVCKSTNFRFDNIKKKRAEEKINGVKAIKKRKI